MTKAKVLFIIIYFISTCCTPKKSFQNNKYSKMIYNKQYADSFVTHCDSIEFIESINYLLSYKNNHSYNDHWAGYMNDSIWLYHTYNTAPRNTNYDDQKFMDSLKNEHNKCNCRELKIEHVSMQLVSLYIISSLYHKNILFADKVKLVCSCKGDTFTTTNLRAINLPYRVKRNPEFNNPNGKMICHKERFINDLHRRYFKWYQKILKGGNLRAQNPMEGSCCHWYGTNN